jgi:dehydration protein DpgD
MGYLLTGRHITADVAFHFGLVNEVVPAGQLDRCVAGWVNDLLRGAPLAVRAIKEAALRSVDMPMEQAFATRFEWEQRRMYSRDAVEGPQAFAEKRDPVWDGR